MSARRASLLTLAALLAVVLIAAGGLLAYKGKQRYDRAIARADARTAKAEAELRSVPSLFCAPLEPGQVCTWPAEMARRVGMAHRDGVSAGWMGACTTLELQGVIGYEDCLSRRR
jgi:hypothetical protein